MSCKDCIYFIKYYEEMYNEDDPDSIFKVNKYCGDICINDNNFKYIDKNDEICNDFILRR